MEPAKNKWPNTLAAEPALFLAQTMREMLTPSAFESVRTPTLNLLSRIVEVLSLAEEAQKARVPVSAVQPAIEELTWSLKDDPIGRLLLPREIDQYPSSTKGLSLGNPSDLQKMHRFTEVLFERLYANYRSTLANEIIDNYGSGKRIM